MISAATLMAVVMAFSAILVSYVVNTRRAGRQFEVAVKSVDIAEAGINKAIYCLNSVSSDNCGSTYGDAYTGETNVNFGGGQFTVTVTGSGPIREVVSAGMTTAGRMETIGITLTNIAPTQDPDVAYSVQSGTSGLNIDNNADITGGPVSSAVSVICKANDLSGPIYVTAEDGLIDGCDLIGDAHADRVTNNKMNGHDVYYKTVNTDNTGVGQAYGGQATPTMPTGPTLDLAYWQEEAEAGGVITGDYVQDGGSIGPKKFTGNLTISGTVTLNGPLWIQGAIRFANNAVLQLNSAYDNHSGLILADGGIHVDNNGQINGSGHIKSFIVVYTVSDSAEAIRIDNNCTGAIFIAPNGGINVLNNAIITAAAGKGVHMGENALISFASAYHDASDIRLAAEPNGTWRIVPGTWREER